MTRNCSILVATMASLLTVSCSTDPQPLQTVTGTRPASAEVPPSTSPLDGLWSGSWGGAEHDGVVMQPVLSEMLIDGDYVDLSGFPGVDALRGTVHIDADAQKLRISPSAGPDGPPTVPTIDYQYERDGERLTLTGSDDKSVLLTRTKAVREAPANLQVEFVIASGFNADGDLLVTEFRLRRTGKDGTPWYEPHERILRTQRASVFLVEESGLKEISIDRARSLVRESMPVALTFRDDDAPPDSSAIRGALSHVLRPGTVVFNLSSSENLPQP